MSPFPLPACPPCRGTHNGTSNAHGRAIVWFIEEFQVGRWWRKSFVCTDPEVLRKVVRNIQICEPNALLRITDGITHFYPDRV